MKKAIQIIVFLLLIASILIACNKDTKVTSNENEEKDVSMLLGGIGKELDSIQLLGELPEPEVAGQRYFYDTKGTKGYFNGFNLGIELAEDQKTVKQIYIEPYDGRNIKVNGFIIGRDIADTNELFGKGQLSSVEKNGKVFTYMSYQDENYNMKCTVTNNQVSAVSFTLVSSQDKEEPIETEEVNTDGSNKEQNENNEKEKVEIEPIKLSFYMTKDEIINKLGDDYDFTTEEDGGYFTYNSRLEYDGISFTYWHDNENVTGDRKSDWITIDSNQYTFNYDIKIGDNAREVLEYCQNKYDNAYDHHNDKDIFGMYKYTEEDNSENWSVLSFSYSDQDLNLWECSSVEDIGEEVTITGISIGYFVD